MSGMWGKGTDTYSLLKDLEVLATYASDGLVGDLIACRGGSAPTTYPANDAAGAGASYTPFLDDQPVLVEVENLDTTNYIDICPDDGTGTYGYLVIGTGGTDAVIVEYKTPGDITYAAEILVAGDRKSVV